MVQVAECRTQQAVMTHKRNTSGLIPFKPGQSGNPSGRAKKTPAEKAAESLSKKEAEKAMKKIVALIDSADDRVALAAAQHVLDRSLGKPVQHTQNDTNVTHNGSAPVSETAEWIADVLRDRQDRETTDPRPN